MKTFDMVYGLGFDVQVSPTTKSGFEPVGEDRRGGGDFFGDLRLQGFAALLHLGFAKHLTVVSGMDYLYDASPPRIIHEAELIKQMLVEDCNIDSGRVSFLKSEPNSAGNIGAIQRSMAVFSLNPDACGIVSNHYHVPRFKLDLDAAGLIMPAYSAEAFLLVQDNGLAPQIVERFGGGRLAERVVQEILGVAAKVTGNYKPKVTSADFTGK